MKHNRIWRKCGCLLSLLLVLPLIFSACRDGGRPKEVIVDVPYSLNTASPASSLGPILTEDVRATVRPTDTMSTPDSPVTPDALSGKYTIVPVSSSLAGSGGMVLVNYDHSFSHTDEVQVITRPAGAEYFLLTDNDSIALTEEVYTNLLALALAFNAHTGGDRLYITSAYRTIEEQQRVYSEYVAEHGEDMAELYVARPGMSEHHTGLAVDLSIVNSEGQRVALSYHSAGEWFNIACTDYGFILRYPIGMEGITHIAYEPWHFRYIGVPNAHAMAALGIGTYESYIQHIKQYSLESGMLYVKDGSLADSYVEGVGIQYSENYAGVAHYDSEAGTLSVVFNDSTATPYGGYLIWYVPAAQGSTRIALPDGIIDYTISGTNDGGFIITAKVG